ncbi:MAG: hypothetical protein PUQ00_20630, partial [Nostoc sp. S13]|nr:hypothetical protein [Nostoc sp. S13]
MRSSDPRHLKEVGDLLKKNSEVRIQESESRRSLRDAKSERGLALRGAISRGFRPATTKVDHQIF